jgi:hypothetical protein
MSHTDGKTPRPNYPNGQLNERDQGELCIAMAIVDNAIVVDFSKPIGWFGFDVASARQFSKALADKADELEKKLKEGL